MIDGSGAEGMSINAELSGWGKIRPAGSKDIEPKNTLPRIGLGAISSQVYSKNEASGGLTNEQMMSSREKEFGGIDRKNSLMGSDEPIFKTITMLEEAGVEPTPGPGNYPNNLLGNIFRRATELVSGSVRGGFEHVIVANTVKTESVVDENQDKGSVERALDAMATSGVEGTVKDEFKEGLDLIRQSANAFLSRSGETIDVRLFQMIDAGDYMNYATNKETGRVSDENFDFLADFARKMMLLNSMNVENYNSVVGWVNKQDASNPLVDRCIGKSSLLKILDHLSKRDELNDVVNRVKKLDIITYGYRGNDVKLDENEKGLQEIRNTIRGDGFDYEPFQMEPVPGSKFQ